MKINYWQDFEEGCYYHIYNHAVSDQNLFTSENDYTDFLSKHNKYLSCVFDTLAYCLMPNHFHFVVKVKPTEIIIENAKNENSNSSSAFQKGEITINSLILDQYRRFLSSYSLSFNFRKQRKGQLFLKRFKRVSLDPDLKLLYMICYLHHNPIHHDFTTDFRSWKYSSYNDYLSESSNDIYNEHIENHFGNLNKFCRLHEDFRLDLKEELNLDYLKDS